MDQKSLTIFIQVAELGSFTRAGEALGYSQPTISFQIRQLENELGAQLFERIGHTVALTDAGRDALAYAQRICRLTQEMMLGSRQRSEVRGTIRLAMADSLCAPLIAGRFAALRAAHPQLCLKVTTAGTGQLFSMLEHNEADLVCTLDSPIRDANYVVADEEPIGAHFVAATGSSIAQREEIGIQEVLQEPLLLTEKGMSYNRLLGESLARDALELRPVLEIGSADLICRLVAEGAGLSFLPDYVTEAAVRAGKLVRLPVRGVQVELWKQLLHHRNKWMSPQMQAVLRHLSDIRLSE